MKVHLVNKTIIDLLCDIRHSVNVHTKEDGITESILRDALGGFLLEYGNNDQESDQSVKILELEDKELNKIQRAILFYKKNSKGVDEQTFNDVLMMRVFVDSLKGFLEKLESEDISEIWQKISENVEYHFAEAKLCATRCNYPWKNEKSNLRQMRKFYDIYRPWGGLCPVHWIYVKGRKYANEREKRILVHGGFNCWVVEEHESDCEYYGNSWLITREENEDFSNWNVYDVESIDYWRSIFGFVNNTCACGIRDCHFGFAKVRNVLGGEAESIPGILEDFVVLVVVENSSGKDSDKIPTDEFSEGMITNLNQLMNYMYANIALYVTRLIVDKARQEGYDVYGEEFANWLDERVLKVLKDNGKLTYRGDCL